MERPAKRVKRVKIDYSDDMVFRVRWNGESTFFHVPAAIATSNSKAAAKKSTSFYEIVLEDHAVFSTLLHIWHTGEIVMDDESDTIIGLLKVHKLATELEDETSRARLRFKIADELDKLTGLPLRAVGLVYKYTGGGDSLRNLTAQTICMKLRDLELMDGIADFGRDVLHIVHRYGGPNPETFVAKPSEDK